MELVCAARMNPQISPVPMYVPEPCRHQDIVLACSGLSGSHQCWQPLHHYASSSGAVPSVLTGGLCSGDVGAVASGRPSATGSTTQQSN
jgi:hypothetical protein